MEARELDTIGSSCGFVTRLRAEARRPPKQLAHQIGDQFEEAAEPLLNTHRRHWLRVSPLEQLYAARL